MPYIEGHYGGYIIHGRDHGPEGTLVQVDYDFPSVAESFGWSIRRVQKDGKGEVYFLKRAPRRGAGCDHRGTDGTIQCPDCGIPASDFIEAADEFLSEIAT